ncbi:MAG: RNase adapter RapZ [Desulfarculales bacterium]|nr:RNase adapter RapZ [Desulfarculales bacterium]
MNIDTENRSGAEIIPHARFVIITGMSGSGKSTVLTALEDLGFYALDNLPVALLPAFVQLPAMMMAPVFKAALVMDLRAPDFARDFTRIYSELLKKGYGLEVLYLEAGDDALVRRFSQTRRSHPLAPDSVLAGIRLERELLASIRSRADQIVDTSRFNVHELRRNIADLFSQTVPVARMYLNFISFGFKYGLPLEADLVWDARFLPNPYFVEHLSMLTGKDQSVIDYIFSVPVANEFAVRLKEMLEFLLPQYHKEGKSQITAAIGCTGGKHRSVALVGWLAQHLSAPDCRINIRHRDIALG